MKADSLEINNAKQLGALEIEVKISRLFITRVRIAEMLFRAAGAILGNKAEVSVKFSDEEPKA